MTAPGESAARPDILAGSATGSIYDLGYRRYDGPRLGRRHAVWALYVHSVRWTFGIGRGGRAKIAPFGLAALVLLPAVISVGVRAIAGPVVGNAGGITPQRYLGFVAQLIVFFVTAQAPELVNRDLRSRLLTLYFSRALGRNDYAVAKYLALTTAVTGMLLVPQLLLLLGTVFSSVDLGAGLGEVVPLVPPVILSAIGASAFFSGVSLVIAAFAPRRAFAAGTIIVVFLVLSGVVEVIVSASRLPAPARLIALLDPFSLLDGLTSTLFGEPSRVATIVRSDLPTEAFAVAAVVVALLSLAALIARYRRIQA